MTQDKSDISGPLAPSSPENMSDKSDKWEPDLSGEDEAIQMYGLPPPWEGYDGPPPPWEGERQPCSGHALCDWVAERTDTVLLAFSGGKDAVAAYLRLKDHFDPAKIIPFYQWGPWLEFTQRTLRYYERELFDGRHIYRLPHSGYFAQLRCRNFTDPAARNMLIAFDPHRLLYTEIYTAVAHLAGVTDRVPWVAQGVRAVDSQVRLTAARQHGPYNLTRRSFWPIWDVHKREHLAMLRAAKIKLAVDYKLFGRSFDGLDYRFTKPVRDHFPEDWKAITDLFGLAEVEHKRREFYAP